MKKILCFDMDGTLANFYEDENCLGKMFNEHFFENLKPLQLATDLAGDEKVNWDNVYIVSACISSATCISEKIRWLAKYLPQIKKSHMIFTKTGESKSMAVAGRLGKHPKSKFYLIDDFSVNLSDWEEYAENYIGVKWLNGINSGRHLTYTHIADNYKQLKQLLEL